MEQTIALVVGVTAVCVMMPLSLLGPPEPVLFSLSPFDLSLPPGVMTVVKSIIGKSSNASNKECGLARDSCFMYNSNLHLSASLT